jgi:hypothetical protein
VTWIEYLLLALLVQGAWAAFFASRNVLRQVPETLLREEREHREKIWRAVFITREDWDVRR